MKPIEVNQQWADKISEEGLYIAAVFCCREDGKGFHVATIGGFKGIDTAGLGKAFHKGLESYLEDYKEGKIKQDKIL